MKDASLVLWVQDATLSVKFYKKVGFEVLSTNERDSSVRLGSLRLMLVTMRDEDEFALDSLGQNKGRGMYIYISVEDVDREYERQVATGIVPRTAPRDWPWGSREFIAKDPDGYKVCFAQKVD